jgi:NADH-quinone oxidoreductase subunit H
MRDALVSNVLVPFVQIVVMVNVLMLGVAYLVLLERKVIAYMQVRLGPRRVGPHGLLQPIADILKLLLKEDIMPSRVDRLVFFVAPIILLIPALIAFAVIPFSGDSFSVFGVEITPWVTDVNVGLLYLLAIGSLGVYGIVMAGWASNSKYPLLGALRSAAQMISYEVPLGLSVISVLMLAGSASMVEIVRQQGEQGVWFAFWWPYPQFVGLFLFFVAAVAETNRAPFDLPEAETELVAGFHTEYSGMKFAFFFLAEYMNMILAACVVTILFLGGWLPITFGVLPREPLSTFLIGPALTGFMWFFIKVFLVLFVYLWIRATFPRYRYDQLMRLSWKWFIPMALIHVMVTAVVILLKG